MSPSKQITAFKLDADVVDAMRRLQEREGISLSEQARRALRMWLAAQGALRGGKAMIGSATWRKLLSRAIDEGALLQERVSTFRQGLAKGSRLEYLKDIAARVRAWADENADFFVQARGERTELPDINWTEESHGEIRRGLEEFLTVRADLELLLQRGTLEEAK